MRSVSKIQTLAQKYKSCGVVNELSELDPVLLGRLYIWMKPIMCFY